MYVRKEHFKFVALHILPFGLVHLLIFFCVGDAYKKHFYAKLRDATAANVAACLTISDISTVAAAVCGNTAVS